MEVRLSINDWDYLYSKADSCLMSTIDVTKNSRGVIVRLREGRTVNEFVDAYSLIIEDSMIDKEYASKDTYHLESIWDNNFYNHLDEPF